MHHDHYGGRLQSTSCFSILGLFSVPEGTQASAHNCTGSNPTLNEPLTTPSIHHTHFLYLLEVLQLLVLLLCCGYLCLGEGLSGWGEGWMGWGGGGEEVGRDGGRKAVKIVTSLHTHPHTHTHTHTQAGGGWSFAAYLSYPLL